MYLCVLLLLIHTRGPFSIVVVFQQRVESREGQVGGREIETKRNIYWLTTTQGHVVLDLESNP